MSNLVINCSQLTGVVYAGKLNKARTMWSGAKEDVTEATINAVIELLYYRAQRSETNAHSITVANLNGYKIVLQASKIEEKKEETK